jgi:RHS repeat-associated protein
MVILESRKGMQGRNQIFTKGCAVAYINEYYPFGLQNQQTSSTQFGSKEQRYKFGSKELFKDFKLESYDFEARMYNPQIARFQRLDPMADKRVGLTPYNYVSNNPILRTDPTGMLDNDYYLDEKGKVLGYKETNEKDRIFVANDKGNETISLGGKEKKFAEYKDAPFSIVKVNIDKSGLGHAGLSMDGKTFGFYPTDVNKDGTRNAAEMNTPMVLESVSNSEFRGHYKEFNEFFIGVTNSEKSTLTGWLDGQSNSIASGQRGNFNLFNDNCTTNLCNGLNTAVGSNILGGISDPYTLNRVLSNVSGTGRVLGMQDNTHYYQKGSLLDQWKH